MDDPAAPGDKYDLGRLASLSRESGRVMLFIDGEVPQHDIAAGYFIIREYLKIFVGNGFRVLFWPYNRMRPEPYSSELEQMGVEVVHGDVDFGDFIRRAGKHVDVTIVSRPEIARAYLRPISLYTRGGIVYLASDLHYLRLERMAEVSRDQAHREAARAMMEQELGVMRQADVALFFSADEVEQVGREDPRIRAEVIPWIQEPSDGSGAPFAARAGIVYLGGFLHTPNIDSVMWFHDEVFPRIRKELPGVQATVVGSNVPPEISALDTRDFKVLGYVEDLGDVFDTARVFVAPLRFGAGIKGKIAMALSYGLPVVTTGVGAEGMGLVDGETALIADGADAFAAAVARLYQDEGLWQGIARRSVEHIGQNYSVAAAEAAVMAVLDGPGRGSRPRALIRSVRSRFASRKNDQAIR